MDQSGRRDMMKLNIPLPGREYDIMIDSGLF